MKIACLAHFYIEENRAGGELMLHALLSSLAAAGHDVTAYITDTVRLNTKIDGVNVVYGVRADVVLDTVDYDVAVTHFQNAAFAMGSAKGRAKPLVYITHNDMPQTKQMIRLLNKRDLVIYNTEWISKLQPDITARQLVVHPPIDNKAFKTKTTGEYVTLVNLTQPKGVDIFYELARLMPRTKFLGVKGGYWKDMQKKSNLPNVTIIEMTANMRDDVYAKSKVVLMPSSYETFGMVAAEAIASGIPVIASPTDGLKENLGDAGIYAPHGVNNVAQWRDELQRLLTDEAWYNEVSKRCLQRSKAVDTAGELKAFVAAVEGLGNANI